MKTNLNAVRRRRSPRSSQKTGAYHLFVVFYLFLGCLIVQAQSKPQAIHPDFEQLLNKHSATEISPNKVPESPNPMLSTLTPSMNANYRAWQNYMQRQAAEAVEKQNSGKKKGPKGKAAKTISERENGSGVNDTQQSAQKVNQFGTNPGHPSEITISGELDNPDATITLVPKIANDDDRIIPKANVTGITGPNEGVVYNASIGTEPFSPDIFSGNKSDFDMYSVQVSANTVIEVDLNTPLPFGNLDPSAAIFFEDGTLVAFNDDEDISVSFDSYIRYLVPVDGTYIICIGGWPAWIPVDPFDEESPAFNPFQGSEGTYELIIQTREIDIDYYSFNLQEGDVFGAVFQGAGGGALLSVRDLKGEEEVSTPFNTSFIFPESHPFYAGAGQTTINYTVEESGKYAISVSGGEGPYNLKLQATRPYLELNNRTVQVVYVDYSGGAVDLSPWYGGPVIGNHTPFADFLPNWGLNPADADAITARITDVVRENLESDFNSPRVNPKQRVIVTDNIRLGSDNELGPDFVGESFSANGINYDVSTVEVSGTIPESGIGTIGIAQSIDPGNFDTEETALLLLDILSGPATGLSANATYRINDLELAPGVTREDAVVEVVGNITAHEAGHYLGNWHLDGFSDVQGIMDEGPGGMFNLAGVGPSGIFGGSDQTDVDFVEDFYSTREAFSGREDTEINTAYALSFIPSNGARTQPELAHVAEEVTEQDGQSFQSYPNFLSSNGTATIGFRVPEDQLTRVSVYDSYGRTVGTLFEGQVEADRDYRVELNAGQWQMQPGIYIYTLETANKHIRKKLIITD